MGRQPWIVFGEMLTRDGVSPQRLARPRCSPRFTAFTLIYAILAVDRGSAAAPLRQGRRARRHRATRRDDTDDAERPLAFAY